jgi:hypothetical protein
VKYEVLGLGTRAVALHNIGRTHEAIGSARRAVELSRSVGDPALFLRSASGLLVLDGDDALAAEAGATKARIACAVTDARVRDSVIRGKWSQSG